jgi:hypothetical protein
VQTAIGPDGATKRLERVGSEADVDESAGGLISGPFERAPAQQRTIRPDSAPLVGVGAYFQERTLRRDGVVRLLALPAP